MRLRFLFSETREPDTEHKEVTQEKRSAVKPKPEHRLQDEHMCARQRVQNRPVNAPGSGLVISTAQITAYEIPYGLRE